MQPFESSTHNNPLGRMLSIFHAGKGKFDRMVPSGGQDSNVEDEEDRKKARQALVQDLPSINSSHESLMGADTSMPEAPLQH